VDKEKGIHTLPVVIGEKVARGMLVGMLVLQYVAVAYLIVIGSLRRCSPSSACASRIPAHFSNVPRAQAAENRRLS